MLPGAGDLDWSLKRETERPRTADIQILTDRTAFFHITIAKKATSHQVYV